MSKGRPRAAARQAPSPSPPLGLAPAPARRPECHGLLARPPLLYLGLPGACISSFPACSPPPPSHTFPPLAVTMLLRGPPSFLPRRGSPPTDLAARIFSRLTELPPPPRHLSRISNLLGLKMQTHRMVFTRLSEVGWVLHHHPETARLFIRSCFQEGVGCPPLFLPRRLQASGF